MSTKETVKAYFKLGPENWDAKEWADGLRLASFVQPWLGANDIERLVREAARDAMQSKTSRREAQEERRERDPRPRKPKQIKWRLPSQHRFYAWVLLKSVVAWRVTGRELTNPVYLAGLIAAGILAEKGGEQTPAWLVASILDILRRVPRDKTQCFRDKVLDPDSRRKDPDGSYALMVRQCISRVCRLMKLDVDPASGRRGQPTVIRGMEEVSGTDYRHFRERVWPHVRPASIGQAGHLSLSNRKSLADFQSFHVLLCESCLEAVMEEDGWPRTIYLPQRGSLHVNTGNSKGDNSLPDLDLEAGRRVRQEFEDENEARVTATGRVFVSVDGAPPVAWTAGDHLRPQFSVELFRGDLSLLWHEVDPPGMDVETSSTTYEVGPNRYTIVQDSSGVGITEGDSQTRPDSVFVQMRAWLQTRRLAIPLLALVSVLTLLLLPTAAIDSVQYSRETAAGSLGQKRNEDLEVRTGLLFLPWSSYEVEITPESGQSLVCSWRAQETLTTAQFHCGPNVRNLDLVKAHFTLVERRFGLLVLRSKPEGLGGR